MEHTLSLILGFPSIISIACVTVSLSLCFCIPYFYALMLNRVKYNTIRVKWIDEFLTEKSNDEVIGSLHSTNVMIKNMSTALNSCEVVDNDSYCADQMRSIIKEAHIPYNVLVMNPGIVLECSRFALSFNGAIYTRFIVQYNLFVGSVISLGTSYQMQEVFDMQVKGCLGCFAFTELSAGVITGIKVETTAVYDPTTDSFTINSNGPNNAKNWISQGIHAEYAVILATLIIEGEIKGPHLFLCKIQHSLVREDGTIMVHPMNGVNISRMPALNNLFGLDYARIEFNSFIIPRSSLLNKYSGIDEHGKYFLNLPDGTKRMIDLLLNRLIAGRVCLSEYSLTYTKNLLRNSWKYAQNREITSPGKNSKTKTMVDLSLILDFFYDYCKTLQVILNFVASTRMSLIKGLEEECIPASVQEAAAVAKFIGSSISVDIVSCLRKVIGSYSLQDESHLGTDSYICNGICFAEGDNTIMELKVVGDLVKGKVNFLPISFIYWSCFDRRWRRLLVIYLLKVLLATCLGVRALEDGQLLRDIAWARGHILVFLCDKKQTFVRDDDINAYHKTVVKFPVPLQI